jgi:hypothetical protein
MKNNKKPLSFGEAAFLRSAFLLWPSGWVQIVIAKPVSTYAECAVEWPRFLLVMIILQIRGKRGLNHPSVAPEPPKTRPNRGDSHA